MNMKNKIVGLFDELHNSVTAEEFDGTIDCALGKEIFVSCSKTKLKLINLIYKIVSE